MREKGEKASQVWQKKQSPTAPGIELTPHIRTSLEMRGNRKDGPKKIKQVWRKKQPPPPPPPPPWVDLPRDITANILQRLGSVEVLETAQNVCTTWRSVCKDPVFWRVIDMSNRGDLHNMPYDLDTMCRHAVDRSQGQLIDINIEYFGTDELLKYIAERCSRLRRLRIAHCYDLSGEALARFPLLEELHLLQTSISSESLEMVGRLCPLLKSFSLNYGDIGPSYDNPDYDFENQYDEAALIIAKSMPELRHLQLFGNSLTNKGLKAILDGCPHLESLDLKHCYSVELSGDLGKRCSQQIKSLRRPYDGNKFCPFSGHDYEDYLEYEDYLDYDDYPSWVHEDSDFEYIFGFF